MSSSPFGKDLDHPFRQFESRNSNLLPRNPHVRFGEPQTSKNSSDPLNLKISEILGPYSHVSPHLLSELKDSEYYLSLLFLFLCIYCLSSGPDNLFGIERSDTPTSPLNKKIHFRPSNSLDKVSNNFSPKHHRPKPTGALLFLVAPRNIYMMQSLCSCLNLFYVSVCSAFFPKITRHPL